MSNIQLFNTHEELNIKNEQMHSKYIEEVNERYKPNLDKKLITDIQKWALLDTQLKIVNEKTKKMRELKSTLAKQICNYIDTNKLNTTIGLQDGELKIYEKREYSPLSYSYIEECLRKIIKNPDHIAYIIRYLKDNREIKITHDIRRTFDHTASL